MKSLRRLGFQAHAIHGDRTQKQRQQALDGFREGRYKILVATDVAARGLDVEGISHVINYDIPENADDYIHRVGRTARAGERGIAITFVGTEHLSDVRAMARSLKLEEQLGIATVNDPPEQTRTVAGGHRNRARRGVRPQQSAPAATTGAAGRRPARNRRRSEARAGS
jgi:ATP-dependent RNA helicase RhlE